jgi:tetratricopeptide (TPR) repeat protein
MAKNTTLGKTIESLKERLASDPLSRAFLQLAEEYRKLGRFEEATDVCLQGLKRHPAYLPARIALGRTYLEAGNLDLAHQTLADVHRTMPENHLAGKLLAEVQRRMGNPRDAADTYRAMLRHSPGDREVEALLRDLQEPPEPIASQGVVASRASLPPAPMAADPALDPALDYRPEDIVPAAGGGGITGGSRATAGLTPDRRGPSVPETPGEAAPNARRQLEPGPMPPGRPDREAEPRSWPAPQEDPEPEGEAGAEEGPDALQTNTLAELYLRQGLVERALEVYKAMLRLDPANEKLRHRLEELASSGAPPPLAGSQESVAREMGPRRTGTRQGEARETEGRTAPEAEAAPLPAHKVLLLQRWLQTIQRGSGAAAGEARDR